MFVLIVEAGAFLSGLLIPLVILLEGKEVVSLTLMWRFVILGSPITAGLLFAIICAITSEVKHGEDSDATDLRANGGLAIFKAGLTGILYGFILFLVIPAILFWI